MAKLSRSQLHPLYSSSEGSKVAFTAACSVMFKTTGIEIAFRNNTKYASVLDLRLDYSDPFCKRL